MQKDAKTCRLTSVEVVARLILNNQLSHNVNISYSSNLEKRYILQQSAIRGGHDNVIDCILWLGAATSLDKDIITHAVSNAVTRSEGWQPEGCK